MRGKLQRRGRTECLTPCFNEARALCAGSFHDGHSAHSRTARFNEARALCAGSLMAGDGPERVILMLQ